MKIGTREVSGVELELHADARTGRWSLERDGKKVGYGETLDQAVAVAAAALRKERKKVSVPFVTKAGERGIAYGLHAGTRNVMVDLGGRKEQFAGIEGSVLRGDTPDNVIARMVEIQQTQRTLQQEARGIERDWSMNLRAAVEQAFEQAQREA